MKTIKTKQIKRMIFAGIFLTVALVANASGIIKGIVVDDQNQPIKYATATLINPQTNEIVMGDICDSNGEFILENVKPGNYILSVRNAGFVRSITKKVIVDSDKNVIEENPIVLKEAVYELPELIVVAKFKTSTLSATKNSERIILN